MHYEFPRTIAFSRYIINVDQVQNLTLNSPGLVYEVQSINKSSGVMYADYFYLEINLRLEKESENSTRISVFSELVWEKPCILKSKIETETLSGTKKYYETFEKELLKILVEPEKIPSKSGKKSKNGLKKLMHSKKVEEAKKVDIKPKEKKSEKSQDKNLKFDETSVLVAFILVILTLLIITLAMFKLAGSIASLSERLYALEDILLDLQKSHENVGK